MDEMAYERNEGTGACATATRISLIIGSVGLGALLMYLFDPDRGRGRRSRLSDQVSSKATRLGRTAEGKARDLRNRAQGLMHTVGLRGAHSESKDRAANESGGYRSLEQSI
ncbi:MAG TPA: hypothetical protein VFH01_13130 [Pyrinomonadaceae bacterium]|nr:hypothetical protein [Pyrinomonadaceae bacterium]